MLSHGTYPVLHAWSDGDQDGARGGAGQGDGPVVQRIPLVPAGELTPDVVVGYPQLRGYCALTADISRHQAARMLRGRLIVELGQADPEAAGGTGRLRRQDVVPQAGRAGSDASQPGAATSQTSQTASPATSQPSPDAGLATSQPGPATGPDAGPAAERSAATSQATPAPAAPALSATSGASPASSAPGAASGAPAASAASAAASAAPGAAPVPDPTPWRTASRVTGVQIWPLLDHLYPAAARRDGLAPLGPTWAGAPDPAASPSLALWAPTAQEVTLLSWETGDPTGSVPLVEGEPRRTRAESRPDGRWEVGCGAVGAGAQYLWEVRVYVPATGRVETNVVTDPYAPALTVDSRRAVAVDLRLDALAPRQWATTPSPRVTSDAARAIYELHVRDFSAADPTVPEGLRGTYAAFTVDSQGTRHLRDLAEAGMDTLHLMPTFDIATIPEERSRQKVPAVPASWGPASVVPQQAVAAVADEDAYNWGYDPYHWGVPEGSYATEGHQDGGARVVEFRQMVGALHALGYQVVLDQVYNHMAACGQDPFSVLDKVVPGYYHRLDAVGTVTASACCANTATENAMCERLMIDSVVRWARWYRVDGFRFDLMGHHPRATMERLRAALDRLTPQADGVDGAGLYLYGEGWNFGEVANNALFTQATQGQLDGTGIGTFNDRLRDAVHGGSPFDPDHRTYQGFGTGLLTQSNGLDPRGWNDQAADLGHRTDLVRLGLAGNLRDYVMTLSDGSVRRGADLLHNGSPAAYASAPQENVNYVDAHDNETLYDLLAYKLPRGMPVADRVRMNTVCLATVTLGQSPAFWCAGTELLRSKSLDRDSFNSGDWFNAIDFSGQSNGFGRGLPPASRNEGAWPIQGPLLADAWLRPTSEQIAAARAQALDLLRLRSSTPLFALGDAALIRDKLRFPGAGFGAPPGAIAMLIDDTVGRDVDPGLDAVLVVFNASGHTLTWPLGELVGRDLHLSPVQAEGADDVVRRTGFDRSTGTVSVPARTVSVLVQDQ